MIDSDFMLDVDKGLRLRLAQVEDDRVLYALTERNRESLREFLGWVDHVCSPDDTNMFLVDQIAKSLRFESLVLVILYEDYIVGVLGYNSVDQANKLAAVGYWLDKDHWGKGIITRSLSALIEHSFLHLGIHRIEIRCAVDNLKSQAIPRRLGFHQEGMLKEASWVNGRVHDVVLYGKTKSVSFYSGQ